MIHGFRTGYFQFEDSEQFEHWSDRDDYPVSARNYADSFSVEETEHTDELILDELDSILGPGWYTEPGNDYTWNTAVSFDTVNVFPFEVQRRVKLIRKYNHPDKGWTEEPYPIPDMGEDIEELMAPAIEPKVFHEL